MDKIAFRNKFRILTPLGHVLRLNSTLNKNGTLQSIEGFPTIEQAQNTLALYCIASGLKETDFKIESYAEGFSLVVPIIDDVYVNDELARKKIFSGKGLKFNTFIPKKHEDKYKPDKFYTREIWFEQSTNHNKGLSLISKKGDSKKFRNAGAVDSETFEKMERLKGANDSIHSSFDDVILNALKTKSFDNRKAFKDYLTIRGFSKRQIDKLHRKVYQLTH